MRVTAALTFVIIQLIRKNSFDLFRMSQDWNFGKGSGLGLKTATSAFCLW